MSSLEIQASFRSSGAFFWVPVLVLTSEGVQGSWERASLGASISAAILSLASGYTEDAKFG